MFTPEHIALSILANAIGLGCVLLLKSAPPRLILYVSLLSMVAIILPWQILAPLFSESPMLQRIQFAGIPTTGLPEAVGFQFDKPTATLTLKSVWLVVGCLWLAYSVGHSLKVRKQWQRSAITDRSLAKYVHSRFRKLSERVRFHRISGSSVVATTGLWNADIWLGDRIETDAQIRAALNHELCHVASKDQITLFLIVIVERLLWWNPLVWLLGRHARRCMEFSCDARCTSLLGQDEYRQSLAELFLVNQTPTSALEIPFGTGSDVVQRMERLKMNPRLEFKHLGILAFAGILLVAIAANAASDDQQEFGTTLIDCSEILPEGVQYNLQITGDIDTTEGGRNSLFVNITEPDNPDSIEWPEDSLEYMECIRKVLGVGEDEGWPGT